MFISSLIKSFSGTTNKKPEVGLGVVGKKTLTNLFFNLIATSPEVLAVINATAQIYPF